MLVKKTVKLRALFIRNESSLDADQLATEMIQCRAALRPYDIVSIGQTFSANGYDGDMVTNEYVSNGPSRRPSSEPNCKFRKK